MTSCTHCGTKIEDPSRIECPACGGILVTSSFDLRAEQLASSTHEADRSATFSAQADPKPQDSTTRKSAIVHRFELAPGCRPQSVVLHGDQLLVLSIDEGDVIVVHRYALDGRAIGTVGRFAIGDKPDAIGDPAGIALDDDANIYLLDGEACKVVKLGGDGAAVATFGPNGLAYPRDLEVAGDGSMLLADTGNHRVLRWDPSGQRVLAIGPEIDEEEERGSSGTGPGEFDTPSGVTVSEDGSIYVADTNNHRIQVFDASGRFVREFGSEGEAAGYLLFPTDVRIGRDGDVFVFDQHGRRIQKFGPDGGLVYSIPVSSGGRGSVAGDIDVGPDEAIYVPLPSEGAVVCVHVVE
jgi:DNA-binding beta-propeller fold protein YncE